MTKGKQPAATVASIPPEVELDDAPLEEEPPLTATPSPLSIGWPCAMGAPLPGLGDPEGKKRVLRLVNHLYGHPLANAMNNVFKFGPRPEVADQKLISYARELMGSLIYATLTRPDCKYSCSKLASVVTTPTEEDIDAMEKVLKYLYATRSTALTFRPGPLERA